MTTDTTATNTTAPTLGERVNEYVALTQAIRAIEDDLKWRKDELRKLEERLLETFAQDGIRNMKTAAGQTVYLNRELFARLVGDPEQAHSHTAGGYTPGLGDFIRPMVNAQTLRAYVREKEESEEEMPEGLQPYIDVTEVYRLRVRS